jgi:hypothetical protein
MPPATLPGVAVLGSPLLLTIQPGTADAAHSSLAVLVPPNPTVHVQVTAQITLADAYGNPIAASTVLSGQYRDSRLMVASGKWCSLLPYVIAAPVTCINPELHTCLLDGCGF